MKLYHFTTRENLWLISQRGLEPYAKDDNAHMTFGEPVVWLTRQETNSLTAGHPDVDGRKVGEPLFGGPVRLTVNIERHNKRLERYPDFLRKHEARDRLTGEVVVHGPDIIKDLQNRKWMSNWETDWWVYSGIIKPSKIDLALTAALALPGVELMIKQAREASDQEREARMMEMREELLILLPDQPVHFFESDEDD